MKYFQFLLWAFQPHPRGSFFNYLLCSGEDSPHLLFPCVNEMRRQRLSRTPQDRAVLQDGLSLPLLSSDISNRVVFEVVGWVPALYALVRQSWRVFNSASLSVSCFFCICIPNKQQTMFICMQMCLSLRLGFWIKSFTVPLISNYTQALTWAPPPGRGYPTCHPDASLSV